MDFTLNVPADPGQIRTIRMFAAAIARQFGSDEASVADLKLAISEACNLALTSLYGPGGDRLTATAIPGERSLEFQLRGIKELTSTPVLDAGARGDLDAASMGRELIIALFPNARVDEDGPSFELPLPLGPTVH